MMTRNVPRPEYPAAPTSDFYQMAAGLEKAVSAAVMAAAPHRTTLENWAWDAYQQKFRFVVRICCKLEERPITVDTTMWFDPSKPWKLQMQQLMDDVARFSISLGNVISY